MMRTFPSAMLAVLLLFSLTVVGCGGESDDTHSDPAPAALDSHGEHGPELPVTAGPGYTVDDVHFMQMMIGHHDQALRMAAMAEPQDAGPEVTMLSRRIDISQRDEIYFMERWLRDRDQAVPDDDQRRSMRMPGMVTAEQFGQLAAAHGPDFDRLFLQLMIEHHVGALEMVDDLFASSGSAQDSELFQFATDVGADQLDEIGIMERLLAQFDPDTRSETR